MLSNTSSLPENWTSAAEAAADTACPGRHLAQSKIPPPALGDEAVGWLRIRAWLVYQHIELSDYELQIAEKCKRMELAVWTKWAGRTVWPDQSCRDKTVWLEFDGLKHTAILDVIHILKKRALVLKYELKTGPDAVVESQDNPEFSDLAILAAHQFEVFKVSVAVVRPFAARLPQIFSYDMENLFPGMTALKSRVRASHDPLSLRVAGEVQCRQCRFSNQCPERAAAFATDATTAPRPVADKLESFPVNLQPNPAFAH